MAKKVYIVGGANIAQEYALMFLERGYSLTSDIGSADLVQFTGGADVDPSFYGEEKHPRTSSNLGRDYTEAEVFHKAKSLDKPMTGICRGGQFLNVMNGGAMYQHINNHCRVHDMHVEGTIIPVTSTHHQQMIPHESGQVLGVAYESTIREYMQGGVLRDDGRADDEDDIEVVFYPDTKCLCFQPHPEFRSAPEACTDMYFTLLKKYLEV